MERDVAEKTVAGLKRAGIDFLTYLPETRLSHLLPVLEADPSFKLVATASEAEAVAIASGAALVGRQPAAYMEGTGLFVCSYSLLTVSIRVGTPLLLLISYVGSFADRKGQRSDMDLTENKYRFVRYIERTEGKPVFLGRG